MFCCHCGKSLPDEAAFCVHCGQAVGQSAPPPPAQPSGAQPAPANRCNKKWLFAIPAVVVAVAVILVALWASGVFDTGGGGGGGGGRKSSNVANDPESVAKAFVEAYILDDYRTQFDLLAWDYETSLKEDYYGNGWSGHLKDQLNETREELKDRYGNYELQLTVTEQHEMTESALDGYDERLHRYFGDYVNSNTLGEAEEGCIFVIEAAIVGDENSRSETHYLYLIKYDGRWKLTEGCYYYGLAEDYYFENFYR